MEAGKQCASEESSRASPSHFELCRFIREISMKLGLQAKTAASAMLVYHSVYNMEEMATFDEVDPYTVATGCVWLAIKGENNL